MTSKPTLTLTIAAGDDDLDAAGAIDVGGIMAASDAGTYVATDTWRREGDDHEPPAWLEAALEAALQEWLERHEQARAAEAAAGWDPRP